MKTKQIRANEEKIIKLLRSTNRPNMECLIDWLCSTDYFTAPCSRKFHLCEKGGLIQHSLSVYNALNKLCDTFKIDIPKESKVIGALLHDVCKINLYKWNKEKKEYEYNNKTPLPIGHGEKSVILILRYIPLTDLEINMIRWHMTRYEEPFSKYQGNLQNVCKEAYMLYFADHISTLYLEGDSWVIDGSY